MNSFGFFVLYLVRVVSIIGMLISPFAARFFLRKWWYHRDIAPLYVIIMWLLSSLATLRLIATVISYVNVHITFVR